MRRLMAVVVALEIAGCAHAPPPPRAAGAPMLQLTPASMGVAVSSRQRLTFAAGGASHGLDALLEIDDEQVRVVAVTLGRTALRLVWDGARLHQQRAAWLPEIVSGARILSDLQLVWWPLDALVAALPQDCRLHQSADTRVLCCAGQPTARVAYRGMPPDIERATLRNVRYGYRFTVEVAPP